MGQARKSNLTPEQREEAYKITQARIAQADRAFEITWFLAMSGLIWLCWLLYVIVH